MKFLRYPRQINPNFADTIIQGFRRLHNHHHYNDGKYNDYQA